MAGEVHYRGLPRLRGLDPQLRRRRLLAARRYAPLSIPRLAIMGGQWDRGEIVITAGLAADERRGSSAKRGRRRKKPRPDS